MPNKAIKMFALLAFAGALAGCGDGSNQSGGNITVTPSAGTVIATVNGQAITSDELSAYIDVATSGDPVMKYRLTDKQRYLLVQELTRATVAAQEAEKLGLAKKPKARAALAVNRMLYIASKAAEDFEHTAKVPDAVLQQKYRERVKELNGNEYKLSRITLKNKAEADKIVSRLDRGGDFAALAKKYSSDSSAKRGGELGWFQQKALQKSEPEVLQAIVKLDAGGYTKTPIKTTSGWLVIRLDDKTKVTAPDFATLKPGLEKEVQQKMTELYLKKLRSTAIVHWNIPRPASVATPASATAAAAH